MKEIKSQCEASKAARLKNMKPETCTGHAAGGKVKSKPKGKGTQVNVIVVPRGGDRQVPVGGAATAAPGLGVPSRAPAPPPGKSNKPMRVVQVPAPQGPLGPLPVKCGGAVKSRKT